MDFIGRVIAFSLILTGLQSYCHALWAETKPESETRAQVAESGQPEPLLVEVFFNKRSAGTHLCYQTEETYWIPFELFLQETRLKSEPATDGKLTYQTTLGVLSYDPRTQKTIEEVPFISFVQLEKSFYVKGRFVQSIFALALDVPWAPGKPSKKKRDVPVITPDIRAPSSSLSFLRFEPQLSYEFDGSLSRELLWETGGRFAGGVWDITFEGDPTTRFRPDRYHWTTYNNNLALRVGTGSSEPFSLLPSLDFTGIQAGWNNKTILSQLDFERYTDSDVFLSLDRTQQRTIEGQAPPASIAELRLEGIVVARQRVGLNGRFIFRNVRMTSDLRKTQVYIYERSFREKPLAILDYTMSILNRTLPAHELLVRAGGGVIGNPLDKDKKDTTSWTGFGHIIYGVHNRMTLEAGIQYNPENINRETYVGTVLSIGSNWGVALYGARSNDRYATDFRLEGKGIDWSLSYFGRLNQEGFAKDSQEARRSHSLRFNTDILRPFDLLLYGKYNRTGNESPDKYLLPGVYWYVMPRLMLSALPNDEKRYRYEANMNLTSQSDLSVTYEDKVINADLDYDFSRSLQSRALYTHSVETGSNVSSLYFDWYPGGNRYDLVRMGISNSGSQTGYSVAWNKFVNAGLQLSLQYSYNMNNAQQLETEDTFSNLAPPDARQYIALAITWDLGLSSKRFYPINRTALSHTRGGLAGSLKIMNETNLKSSDINDVDILLNRRKLGQRQVDGSFFVGNLKPGVYAVDVDTENLPLELNIRKKTTYVEVLNGAVSEVIIPVYAEYSIAGKVTDSRAEALEGRKVTVIDENGKVVDTALTNMFGYYRTKGLQPGTYTVSVSNMKRPVTIKNDYIYGFDFSIQETALSEAEELNSMQESKTDEETAEKSRASENNEQR